MRSMTFLSSLLVLLVPLAACDSPDRQSAPEPTSMQDARPTTTSVTAVVQPKQLVVTALDRDKEPVGEARALTVRPVVAGERLQLDPVTQ